jgi:hypothetical protein
LYKRGPAVVGRPGGLLIEIVEDGKGCAGGGAGRRSFAHFASVLEALVGAILRVWPRGWVFGWLWDELESLILAQNERWRHA